MNGETSERSISEGQTNTSGFSPQSQISSIGSPTPLSGPKIDDKITKAQLQWEDWSTRRWSLEGRLMTQNINDTMVKQTYMRQRMHAIVEQSLLKPQSFPNRAPQKVVFYLVKKENGGLNTTKVPETFCQRLNDVAKSFVSLSLASKMKHIALANCQWDRCNWHDKTQ